MNGILLHLLPASLYASLWFACRPRSQAAAASTALVPALLAGSLLSHAWTLGNDLFVEQFLRFGFINAFSLTMWLAISLYALESLVRPINQLLYYATPIASISVILPVLGGGHPLNVPLTGWPIRLHIVVAMFAYSLFTLAAFHALLMLGIEKALHEKKPGSTPLDTPPLLTLELLLFKLIGAAFVFLTITVGSGLVFSEQIFGTPFTLSHKSVFSILAWAVFGLLLVGRFYKGWRGKTALRWTLSGLLLMLLAYAGSRFVIEFILGRSQ